MTSREGPLRFLQTAILPYVGSLLIIAGLAYLDAQYMPVFVIVTGVITAKFGVEAYQRQDYRIF